MRPLANTGVGRTRAARRTRTATAAMEPHRSSAIPAMRAQDRSTRMPRRTPATMAARAPVSEPHRTPSTPQSPVSASTIPGWPHPWGAHRRAGKTVTEPEYATPPRRASRSPPTGSTAPNPARVRRRSEMHATDRTAGLRQPLPRPRAAEARWAVPPPMGDRRRCGPCCWGSSLARPTATTPPTQPLPVPAGNKESQTDSRISAARRNPRHDWNVV